MIRTATSASLLLLAACSVQKDEGNGTTAVTVDTEAAENTAEAVGDKAQEIGGHIANDVKQTGAKVQNEVGDVDVDVDVNRNGNAN
jgi:predicted lactoylglutathione lyase